MLRVIFKEKKSSINQNNDDLSKKSEIMQKRYNGIVVEYESNNTRMKFLEDNFNSLESFKKISGFLALTYQNNKLKKSPIYERM